MKSQVCDRDPVASQSQRLHPVSVSPQYLSYKKVQNYDLYETHNAWRMLSIGNLLYTDYKFVQQHYLYSYIVQWYHHNLRSGCLFYHNCNLTNITMIDDTVISVYNTPKILQKRMILTYTTLATFKTIKILHTPIAKSSCYTDFTWTMASSWVTNFVFRSKNIALTRWAARWEITKSILHEKNAD